MEEFGDGATQSELWMNVFQRPPFVDSGFF